MIRLPPRSTRTGTLLPCTTLFRSGALVRLIAMSGLLASDGRAHRGLAGDRGTGGARGPHPAGRSARGGWRGLQFFGFREESRVGVPTRPVARGDRAGDKPRGPAIAAPARSGPLPPRPPVDPHTNKAVAGRSRKIDNGSVKERAVQH